MKTAVAYVFVALCLTVGKGDFDDSDADPCKQIDFHYVMTECDIEMGRWRVQVPSSGMCPDVRSKSSAATRINNCRISCDAGYYFDIGDLTCRMCRPGTFSLGGGVLFDTWDDLPEGFYTQVESFRSSFSSPKGRFNSDVNCSQSRFGWQPRGDFIASMAGPCAATLTYTVHLVKPGNLSYVYQYSDKDVIFDFEAHNDQCQSISDSKEYRWPSATHDGEWKRQVVQLKSGQNVLQWKTIGMDIHQGKPVLIKEIEISGVAFASSCTPCRAGTYSAGGARSCIECKEGFFAPREASSCSPCNNVTEFAPRGSATCHPRSLCTHNDYYESRTPCDENNKSQHIYRWMQPKICRDDVPEAARLPAPSEKKPCPPCNAGMEYRNGSTSCQVCPKGTFSDGVTGCKQCPPHTLPNYGYQITRWTEMPKMMRAACMDLDGSTCSSTMGWQVAGSHIHSGHRHTDGAYLLLSLDVAGFRSAGRVLGDASSRRQEVGRISFSFQLDCNRKCEFMFMQGSDSKGVVLVQSWSESQGRQEYVHSIMQNSSYSFSWAFQQLPSGDISDSNIESDVAQIFSINVTNTIDGGAAACLPCRQDFGEHGHEQENFGGCLPCPMGAYMEANSTECTTCPKGTVVSNLVAYGEETCEPCGPGLTSDDGVNCVTSCVIQINHTEYDFRGLSAPTIVRGNRLFTASGAVYYHLFNISICGWPQATCSNNVSYQVQNQASRIESLICRTTIVPSQWAAEDLILSTQAVTLGDELVGVSKELSYMGVNVIDEFIKEGYEDLHFYYSTPLATRSCPQGRTTIITFRCSPLSKGNGTIHLPTKCPDGTCDGCNFNFLWAVEKACPLCTPNEYRVVRGECIDGVRDIHYLPTTHCIMPNNVPESVRVQCTAFVPLGLQVLIIVAISLASFLCGLMCFFYKKTQRLEYKYMKLVQSSGGRDGDSEAELAPAESCGLDDGEEEDIQFSHPRPAGILNRIMSIKQKSETGNSFETIQLTKSLKEQDNVTQS